MSSASHLRMRRAIGVAAALLLAMGNSPARAAEKSPCTDPIVLPTTKVQVFLIPYQSAGALTERGRELATIVQRHVLFAALKYQSIAVEELTGDSSECGYENTQARILSRLKAGQVGIFIRGRLFEQAGDLRLQTTVSVKSSDQAEILSWPVNGSSAAAFATLPKEPILFAPRTIPLTFLENLQPAQLEAQRLYESPDRNSTYSMLPTGPKASFLLEVLGVDNDWMQVRMFPSTQHGWILAHALASGSELKGTFPELHFIDGLIGYHVLRHARKDAGSSPSEKTLSAVSASFDQYLNLSSTRAESDTRALAAVIAASAQWELDSDTKPGIAALRTAQNGYSKAEQIAPTSTVPTNFYLATSLALCSDGDCKDGADQLHTQFLNAIARDPTNKELLNDISILYDVAASGHLKLTLTGQAIADQRRIIDGAKKSLR
jgi:hypothetical protein